MPDKGFAKESRLLSEKEFTPVFTQADLRVSSRVLLVLGKASDLERARLGIVVGKKQVRGSVQRNRIKRIIREAFRSRKCDFGALDLVILARKGLDALANAEIHAQLDSLFDELCRKRRGKS